MSSYRDNEAGWDPMQRQRPSTRVEKSVAVLAVIAALFLIAEVIGRSKGAPEFLRSLDFGMAPFGLVLLGMAWTYLERAGANRAGETYSQRTLRLTALAFFLLGAVMIGVGVYDHFKGAF